MTTTQANVVLGLQTGSFEASAKRAERALEGVGNAGGASARQIAALTRLPTQFDSIATQLAGATNPLLALSAGGQILRTFSVAAGGLSVGVGAAAAGLAGLAAAGAGFAIAANEGRKQAAALRDTLILTGNAAGLTASSYDALAQTVEARSQQTISGAREIVSALAATGQTSARVVEGQATAIARIADLSGKSGKEIASGFADQLEAPARFAAKLNEAYNFLSVAEFKRIKRLEDQKRNADAVNLTNELLTKSLDAQRGQLGTLESAWDSLTKKISGYKQALFDLGKPDTTKSLIDGQLGRLQDLEKQLSLNQAAGRGEAAIPGLGSQNDGIRRQIAEARSTLVALQRRLDVESTNAIARSDAAASNREQIKGIQANQGKPAEALSAIRDPREQYRADFLRAERQFYVDLEAQDRKLRELAAQDPLGDFIVDVESKVAGRDEARLQRADEFLQELVDANARATAELIADERQRGLALIELDRQIGLRRVAQAELTGAALVGATAEVNRKAALSQTSLDAGIADRLKRSADATSERMTESISTGILEGFRRGGSFAEIFISELKAQFAKTVLAPVIKPTVEAGNNILGSLLQGVAGFIGGSAFSSFDTGGYGITSGGSSASLTGELIRGRRAYGGPVEAGGAYLVGERGPELLQMGRSAGYVTPLQGGGSGGVTNAPNIRVDARADQGFVLQAVAAGVEAGNRELLELLRRRGVL